MKTEASIARVRPFIAGSRAGAYLRRRMTRLLSLIVLALALVLSPMAMAHGAMPATAQPATHSVMASSHCSGDEQPAPDENKSDQLSCAAACAALPAVSPGSTGLAVFGEPPTETHGEALIGFVSEGETPPPRR